MRKNKLIIISTLTAIVMSLSLSGCSNTDDNDNISSENSSDYSSSISDDNSDDGVIDDLIEDTESDVSDFVSDTESDVDDIIDDDNDNDNEKLDDDKITNDDEMLDDDEMLNDDNVKDSDSSSSNSSNNDLDSGNATAQVIANLDTQALESLDSTSFGWGQGTDVDDENRPISCDTYQDKYGEYDTYFIKEDEKNIYLTFDEGYENGYTSQILDVLKEKDCSAIFFVTLPYVEENPELIQRMIDEGHIIGNHSVSHKSMPTLSISEMTDEIMQLHEYMVENFNYTMTLFRPPMGEWSEQVLATTQSLGYSTVFWSFAYQDWETDNQPDPTQSLEKITSASHSGAIYLLHAVSETNTSILSDFIDNIRAKGLDFSTDI